MMRFLQGFEDTSRILGQLFSLTCLFSFLTCLGSSCRVEMGYREVAMGRGACLGMLSTR